ncbi:MAG: enoyl-CoA hydratase/isomerase family protein [Chloroflexi bacterium]|nr:enoyl-CoA hydratase/isomerase family protein [Chloroflexota bacterium]
MSLVNYAADNGIAVLELNAPPVNSYNLDLLRELDAAIVRAREDDAVQVIVVRGAGDRFFCAGADVRFFATAGSRARYNFALYANETFNRLEWTAKLTIAALNGTALGGGLELAMACDLRLARRGERVQLGLPESNLGLLPGTGGTQRLPRLIGKARALEMMVTGRSIAPDEALGFGLVNQVYDADGFMDKVMEYARQFLPPARASKAVGAIKRAVQTGLNLSVADGIAVERELLQQLFESEDANEGIKALLEKRKASFTGQ